MSDIFDLLLTGGTVIDPASGTNQKLDVGITAGRIAAIRSNISPVNARKVLNVDGSIITPGLIDFHVHSYWGVSPYGFNADPVCLASGVTTTMDAGSSGPSNFLGFRRLVYEQSRTRMLAFVAMAQHGVLNDPGELENLRFADPEGAAHAVAENRDIAIGIKVRMHKKAVGENSREALQLAIKAGESCRAPVMVHVGDTAISMEELVDSLRAGDIVTHCYTPQQPSIVDKNGRLLGAVRKAQERGVIFDVGHAGGHFGFDLVRRAMDDGLLPDIISSDLHGRLKQPGFGVVGDLPTVMTKFLALGLSLERIIAACTNNPARAVGWHDGIGSLEVGREADIAVLQILDDPVMLSDSVGVKKLHRRRIAARWTVRAGELFDGRG
ncbi:MAG TPA: amidohydrolase/deacetylase family metallohydrolase [Candidatus Polarisedimenticolaceae bacterium]|nr:amidohydrolase/deacetylase family metallohydrolase [Candidatus Polarisedimenticolaceae bacterium]